MRYYLNKWIKESRVKTGWKRPLLKVGYYLSKWITETRVKTGL